ncbi:MAG: flagellar hook-associated protein FlgK [Rubricoccaceae bacterium]
MSINGLLQMGRRSLMASESAMQTTGQNISGAGVEGFSRRRIALSGVKTPLGGVRMPAAPGTFRGAGVAVSGYERLRDGLLDAAARAARAGLGAAEEELRAGMVLEGAFADGPASLGASLRAFWNAFADAADAPTDLGVRGVLLQRADALAGAFHRYDAALGRLADDTRGALGQTVEQFNTLVGEVARLNEAAASARAAGAPDFAAEDERDRALRTLAELAPLRVDAEADGSVTVSVQGMRVVQGREARLLEQVGPPDPADAVRFRGTGVPFRPGSEGGGRLGGQLRTLGETIPAARGALDALATRLTQEVNAAHGAGYGLSGATGLAFFDPAGTSAAAFRRSPDLTDPRDVALAGQPGETGDATVALALAGLRAGFEEEAAALTAALGRGVATARAATAAGSALVAHADALAESVAAVSLDEEMTRLIQYQQSYAASARVISAAQSMFDTLLTL